MCRDWRVGGRRGDNAKHPLGARQFELRQKGLQERLAGRGAGRVQEVAKGQYVELQQERSDRIFVVIAEFGNAINPVTGGTRARAQPDRRAGSRPGQHHHLAGRLRRAHYEKIYFSDEAGADRC